MRTALALAVVVLALDVHPSLPVPTPRALIDRGLDFMGGAQAVRDIRSRRTTAVEVNFAIGQEEVPGEPAAGAGWQSMTLYDYTRGLQRAVTAPPFAPTARIPAWIVQGDRSMLLVQDTLRRRVGGNGAYAATARFRREARLTPEALLLAAAALSESDLRPAPERQWRGRALLGVEARLPLDTVTLWFDPGDGRLVRAESTGDDPIFGRRVEGRQFSAWRLFGNVRLPAQVEVTTNGLPRTLTTIANIEINASQADSTPEVPAEFAMTWTPEQVSVAPIAPQIYRLEGGQGVSTYGGGVPYYSIAVQQGDSIVLIEAPVSDERTQLVLDTLRARFPSTPVTTFVVTHAHFDHVSGARAAFRAGLRAVAARELTGFMRDVGLAPGQKPTRPRVVTAVDDSLSIGTGDSRFTLYRVPTVHASGMLLAYFPAHRLIVESDLQGLATATQQHELVAWVRARNLDVARVVGTHGNPVTWDQFAASVK